MNQTSRKKLIVFSPQLAEAIRLGSTSLEIPESSFIRSACILYLRGLGDNDIDALLDDLKNRVPRQTTIGEIRDGKEIIAIDTKEKQ